MDSEDSISEQIEAAAARWFARQQNGAWTDADQAQFETWLETATAHRIQYIRVANAWDQCARMQALGAGVPAGVVPGRESWGDARFPGGTLPQTRPLAQVAAAAESALTQETPEPDSPADSSVPIAGNAAGARRRWITVAAAAAVLVVTVGIVTLRVGLFSGTHYSTSVGGMESLALADGSRVTLNTDTSIRVSLSDGERRIKLEQGEAFFEVAKDPGRPFVVYAGDKRVMAVGTKFSVRREQEDVQVVVIEGRVNLSASAEQALVESTQQASTGAAASSPPPTALDAGAIARTSKSAVLVRPDAASEAEKLLSWRRGYLYFDNVTLAEAIAEFNRYNTRQIVLADPEIASLRIGGNFRSNNIDAFIDLMQNGFPISIEQTDDTVIMKGEGR